jgi:hypothetical protein
MKVKIKQEGKRVVVYKEDDSVLSIWSVETINKYGGLEKCVENLKKMYPKVEIEIINAPAPAPTPVPEPPPAPEPAPEPAPAPNP